MVGIPKMVVRYFTLWQEDIAGFIALRESAKEHASMAPPVDLHIEPIDLPDAIRVVSGFVRNWAHHLLRVSPGMDNEDVSELRMQMRRCMYLMERLRIELCRRPRATRDKGYQYRTPMARVDYVLSYLITLGWC
jgi:hypothetical protein